MLIYSLIIREYAADLAKTLNRIVFLECLKSGRMVLVKAEVA